MKFEERIKEKFLYSKNNNLFKILYFFLQRFKLKDLRKNYTVTGVDLLLDKFFKNINIKKGIYIDIGCNHPFSNNNTYLLHKNGWSGINIDLDFHYIDMFNHFRPKDFNKQIAIADRIGQMDFFFYHNKSAINTLSEETHISRGSNAKAVKKIQTNTLDNVIKDSPYANKKINLLTVDVEGFEINVLKGFNLERYSPDIVVIEFTDNSLNKQEFYYHNIQSVINSEIYKHMSLNNYSFVNWIRSDLVFVSKYINN